MPRAPLVLLVVAALGCDDRDEAEVREVERVHVPTPDVDMGRTPMLEPSELDHGIAGWFDVDGARSPERQRFDRYARPPRPKDTYGAWDLPQEGAPPSTEEVRQLWIDQRSAEPAGEDGPEPAPDHRE